MDRRRRKKHVPEKAYVKGLESNSSDIVYALRTPLLGRRVDYTCIGACCVSEFLDMRSVNLYPESVVVLTDEEVAAAVLRGDIVIPEGLND